MGVKKLMVTPTHSVGYIASLGVQIGSFLSALNAPKKRHGNKTKAKKRK